MNVQFLMEFAYEFMLNGYLVYPANAVLIINLWY